MASRAFNNARVIDAVGGDLTAPTWLQIYPSHGNPNQLWRITQEGQVGSGASGYYVYSIKADETEMAWDIPYGDPADGNYVQIYPWHGGANQLWREEHKPVEAVVIKSMHSNWVIDVPGFDGGFVYVQHYPENGGFNQAWELDGAMGAPQRIRSISSGLYLTSSIVTIDNDSLIYQTRALDNDKQRWRIELGSGNIGTIRNVDTGHFLAVQPGPVTSATVLRGYPGDGTPNNQRWHVIS
jgi:hypothetical protein